MTSPLATALADLVGYPLGIPGGPEVWIIGLVVLLLFGSRKLPDLARSMGTSITEFKRGLKAGDEDGKTEIDSDSNSKDD